jgi:hypothetical protein
VLGGLQQDPLEIETVGGLHVCALGDRHARGAEALGELVTHPFQLPEIEQPRVASALWGGLFEAAHRVSGDERIGQLAFELRDLRPQRAPGSQLVDFQVRFTDRKDDLRLPRLKI